MVGVAVFLLIQVGLGWTPPGDPPMATSQTADSFAASAVAAASTNQACQVGVAVEKRTLTLLCVALSSILMTA